MFGSGKIEKIPQKRKKGNLSGGKKGEDRKLRKESIKAKRQKEPADFSMPEKSNVIKKSPTNKLKEKLEKKASEIIEGAPKMSVEEAAESLVKSALKNENIFNEDETAHSSVPALLHKIKKPRSLGAAAAKSGKENVAIPLGKSSLEKNNGGISKEQAFQNTLIFVVSYGDYIKNVIDEDAKKGKLKKQYIISTKDINWEIFSDEEKEEIESKLKEKQEEIKNYRDSKDKGNNQFTDSKENKNKIENFSEYEIEVMKIYKEHAEKMLDFITKLDYVGKFGFEKKDVEDLIKSQIKRFQDRFSHYIIDKNEFSSQEKAQKAFQAIKDSLEKIEKPIQAEEITEEKGHPERAASWHTIYKLENSPDMTYSDLDASTEKERNEKFLDLTRKLWGEFSVHGGDPRINDKGEVYIPCESDLDGESYLKILELAGFSIDRSKVNFVKKGEMPEEGVIGDTSKRNGVVAEEKGKRIIFDHHTPEAVRDTSATKYTYETLVKFGLLEKNPELEKFVEFVTKVDSFYFSPDEEKKVYENYPKNLYGLCNRMKPQDILELFKKSSFDPSEKLDDDYLKKCRYFNPAMKREETLFQLAQHIEQKIKSGEKEIDNLEKMGFFVDTGDDRFGKILIDTKKINGNGNWYPKVDSENHSGQLAIKLKGYGGYLLWSQEENSFILYTNKRMDENSVPGGFIQGENMRGHILVKGFSDPEPLKMKMEDVFSKLAGKKFEFEKKLKEKIETESKGKEIIKLIIQGNLTEDVLKQAAKDSKISLKRLLDEIINQLNYRVKKTFQDEVKKMPKGKDTIAERNRVAIEVLLEYQKTKNGGKTDPQPAGTPPQQPPALEKLDSGRIEDELRKIKNDFGVDIQGDQIVSEDSNQKIINNLGKALGKINKNELNESIKMIALQKTTSGVIGNGDKINLQYTLSPQEMADQLRGLIVEAKQKQSETKNQQRQTNGFYDNQFIKDVQTEYPTFLANFEKQLDEQNVPEQAQLNLLEILSGAKLSDIEMKKLSSAKIRFEIKQQSNFPDEIENVSKNTLGELEISLGRIKDDDPSKSKLISRLKRAISKI